MDDKPEVIKMARSDEPEQVRTTIVGGRPPGAGRGLGNVPRGVEVLIKKAAVDAAFRDCLLDERADAAAQIDLVLEPAEEAMLAAIPRAQLEQVIAGTRVSPNLHAAFMTYTAAVMLAALGAGATLASAAEEKFVSRGAAYDYPIAGVAPAETAVAVTGAVGGVVYDPQGKPHARATVRVGETGLTAVTADDGTFKVQDLPPGQYEVACEAEGFNLESRANVVVAAGYTTQLNFTLAWAPEPCGGARPDEPGEDW